MRTNVLKVTGYSIQLSDSPAVDTSCIAELVEDRVTAIQVNLSPEEQSLLALGPKFALTLRIDETLMHTVKAETASCAFKLRWMTFMDNTASCPTALQHLARSRDRSPQLLPLLTSRLKML